MNKVISMLLMAILVLNNLQAQVVKRLPSGIECKTIKPGKVKKKAKVGDMINTVIEGRVGGKLLYTTKTVNKGLPVNFKVEPPKFKGDVMEGIMQMNEGDSTVFYIPADSFFRGGKPPFVKPGEKVIYNVKINWIKTPAEVAKENKAYQEVVKQQEKQKAMFAKMQADQKKAQAKALALVRKDEAALAKYALDNRLDNVKTTKSGLKYVITQEGDGPTVPAGKQVVMNYTGSLLNGTKFDSNIDSAFGHVQPFMFPLGQGRVIRGWDEGIQLLKKGSKAKFLIPSGLGYGPMGNSGGKIPADANLIFDVELVDFMDPPPPPAPAPPAPPVPAPPTPPTPPTPPANDAPVASPDTPPVDMVAPKVEEPKITEPNNK